MRKFLCALTVLALLSTGVVLASGEKEKEQGGAQGTDLSQAEVEVLGGFSETEFFNQAIEPFAEETGMTINASDVASTASVILQRVRAGDPPDLYVAPQPGVVGDLVANDAGIPLVEEGVFTQDELNQMFSPNELALGQSADGTQYALPIRANLKSAIWYNPQMFDRYGYEIPETWDEMIALSDQIVEDGMTPWCHAFESGSASGWPGTDWIEDIVLHKEGPEVYNGWINGEVKFTDPRIEEAFQMFIDIVRTDGYTFGGPTNAVATPFREIGDGLFPDEGDEEPNCFMFKQAQFIMAFVQDRNEQAEFGETIDFFDFPTINPEYSEAVLGAGIIMGMLKDSPASRALIRHATTPEFQVPFAQPDNRVATNNNVEINEENYPNDMARQAAQSLESEGAIFGFDASDMMPAAVGAGSFWTAVLELVQGAELQPQLEMLDQDFEDATS